MLTSVSSQVPQPPKPSGWHARLDVTWARRPAPAGPRTVPIHRAHIGPLRVLRHHHPDGDDRCQQVLVHPPGGMVGGDRLDITLAATDAADVLVTTPGAAKFYRSIAGPATQHLATQTSADSAFQLLPQPTIVFDGADVVLNTEHRLIPGARLLAWDILALGGHHAQPLTAGRVHVHTTLHVGEHVHYHETMRFTAGDRFTASPLGLGGASVIATLLASAPDASAIAAARDLARTTPAPDGLRHAASVLAGPQPLLVVRALGNCADAAFRWFSQVRDAITPAVLARPASTPRIWFT